MLAAALAAGAVGVAATIAAYALPMATDPIGGAHPAGAAAPIGAASGLAAAGRAAASRADTELAGLARTADAAAATAMGRIGLHVDAGRAAARGRAGVAAGGTGLARAMRPGVMMAAFGGRSRVARSQAEASHQAAEEAAPGAGLGKRFDERVEVLGVHQRASLVDGGRPKPSPP
jgi:hypothetical protein